MIHSTKLKEWRDVIAQCSALRIVNMAREAVPALLDEVERLRGCARGRKVCDETIENLEKKLALARKALRVLVSDIDNGFLPSTPMARQALRETE